MVDFKGESVVGDSMGRAAAWVLAAALASSAAGLNLELTSATYVGGAGADSGRAVEIAPDGSVFYAGSLVAENLGTAPVALLGGGNGVVIRMDGSGGKVLGMARLPSPVEDMEINHSNGKIAVAGAFGIAYLDAAGKTVLWSKTIGPGGGATDGPGRRVSVGSDGTVAALFNKKVSAFDEAGNPVGQFSVEGTWSNDIAVYGRGKLMVITGFTQKDGGGCSQLQVAWIRAYDATGAIKWKAYDWTHAEAFGRESSCADTRGYMLTMGRDDKLYFAGESAGGNTIFRYGAHALTDPGNLIGYDAYTQAYNISSNHITFFGRYDPATGALASGQLILPRLPTTKGNTIRVRGLAADEQGYVYVTGKTACCIENRDKLTVNGKPVGPGDGYIFISNPDFKGRVAWTTLAGGDSTEKNNRYAIGAITAASGKVALVGTAIGTMMTRNALQATGNALSVLNSDGYLAIWPSGGAGSAIRLSTGKGGRKPNLVFARLGVRYGHNMGVPYAGSPLDGLGRRMSRQADAISGP